MYIYFLWIKGWVKDYRHPMLVFSLTHFSQINYIII